MTAGWLWLAVLPTGLAAAAYLRRWAASRIARRVTWYRMLPSGAPIEWEQFPQTVANIRKNRHLYSGRLMILRLGTETGATNIWVGVCGVADPQKIAAAIARGSGSQLGEAGDPPWPLLRGTRWRMGFTEPAPSRKEKDATDIYLRDLDARTIPEAPTFPVNCSLNFTDEDDAFLALIEPTAAANRVKAMCLTTTDGLDMSFTKAAEMRRGWLPSTAGWLPMAAAVAVCAVAAVPLWAAVWPAGSDPGALWRTAVLSLFGLLAVLMFWGSLSRPPMLRLLTEGRSPRFPRRAKKGKLLPTWHIGDWAAGDERAGTDAPQKPAPPEALGPHGALIGSDPLGQECRLPDELRYRGTIAWGDPGMGKTTFLLNLLAHDAERRAAGGHVANVWIETKGEGAERAFNVMQSHGCAPLMLMGSEPTGMRLELVDRSRPAEASQLLTDAIRYAFEADDIREASADVLTSVFQAALAFPPDAVREIGIDCVELPNVIDVAFKILGGVPEEHKHVKQVLRRVVPAEHRLVIERQFDKRQFDQDRILEPARNKLQNLRSARGLFEPGARQSVSFRQLLEIAQPVVLNLGRTQTDSDLGSDAYTDLTAQRCAAICTYVLWQTIQRDCSSWQAQGKIVAVYSDELMDICGFGKPGSLEVVRSMADQGRSRGLVAAFGTQRPDQLPPGTRTAVESYATQAVFALQAPTAKTDASELLDGAYTPAQISALPRGQCAIGLAAEGRKAAPFTLHPRLF